MFCYEKKESLATISFEREDARNFIDTQSLSELEAILAKINADSSINVVLVAGEGMFSSKIDLERVWVYEDGQKFLRRFSATSSLSSLDRPTIAAIEDEAIGQGLELALACDIRLCTETARFAMDHITHGDIPWDGGTQKLSRLVGKARAMEMILTGKIIDAHEAQRIGLVSKVVSAQELMPLTLNMAQAIASKGPIALRYAKEAICKGMDLSLDEGLRLEGDLYFLLHTTKDRTEGIRAFQEKRKPNFEGR